jgi:hypothetical protein
MIRFRPAVLTLLTALLLPTFNGAFAAEETPVEAPNPPAAKAGILDIIPADAGAAFAIRNLEDLKTKGDKFIDETQMKVFLRPSQLFDMGLQWIGIEQGVDDQAAMALILANFKSVGVENPGVNNLEKTLVLAIPFTDLDKIASDFSLKAADLKLGRYRQNRQEEKRV